MVIQLMSVETVLSTLRPVDIINIVIFLSLGLSGYVVFYFAQKANPQNPVTLSIFALSFGLNLIGLSQLFRIGSESFLPFFILFPALAGSILTLLGIYLVLRQRSSPMMYWKKRHEELQSIIKNLKDKYYKQEISEDELKSVHSSLLKELAELEVKMKENVKKEPKLKPKKSK